MEHRGNKFFRNCEGNERLHLYIISQNNESGGNENEEKDDGDGLRLHNGNDNGIRRCAGICGSAGNCSRTVRKKGCG